VSTKIAFGFVLLAFGMLLLVHTLVGLRGSRGYESLLHVIITIPGFYLCTVASLVATFIAMFRNPKAKWLLVPNVMFVVAAIWMLTA